MQAYWQNTAGHWYEKFLLQDTKGKQAADKSTLLKIVFNIFYIALCIIILLYIIFLFLNLIVKINFFFPPNQIHGD